MSSTTASPVPAPKSANPVLKFFERVGTDIVNAAKAVKNVVVKAAAAEPEIASFVSTYGTELETLVGSVSPASESIIKSALTVAGSFANVLNAGGSAAEANLLNQGFDQATIDAGKVFVATVKSVAGSKPAAS